MARLVAMVLLLAAAAGLPHLPQDDQGCVRPAAEYAGSEPSPHGLRAPGEVGHHDHCAVCHWTRSLRSPLTILGVLTPAATPPLPVHGAAVAAALAPVVRTLPARAPPFDLL